MKIAVCASGPSLTKDDCDKVREKCDLVIAVNDTWRMVDADHLYGADFNWWNKHHAEVRECFDGQCWSCETPKKTNWGKNSAEGITLLRCETDPSVDSGLATDPGCVNSGGNSGYQAINLALHLGAKTIILLGFDMCWNGGKAHWFGNHPKGLNNAEPNKYIAAFRTIKPESHGIEIVNCSRYTALDAFPCRDLDDAL